MPAPQKKQLSQLSKSLFLGKNIALPIQWAKPGIQYPDAFEPDEVMVIPNPPTTLFKEPNLNKYSVDTAKDIGKLFEKYIEGICGAVCDAIDKWLSLTSIASVIINGSVGILLPGGVIGPPLMPFILASAPMSTPQEIKYSKAIAATISNMWQLWQAGLTGVLMYPPFAAFPGPMAPPTPNTPVPLITFASPGEAGLSPASLKALMMVNLADPDALHAMDLFDSLSTAFNTIFQQFKATTLVQNVLGTGPIPTFAPPFVPVGPVLGGFVIPTPGVIK